MSIRIVRLGTPRARGEGLRIGTVRRTLELLAALSHSADFAVGCSCESEARCHRSLLRALLAECGARIGS